MLVLLLSGCSTVPEDDGATAPKTAEETKSARLFEGTVRKVLEHRCIHCHHAYAINGGLNLQDREGVFRGNAQGPFLVSGKPDQSRIWRAIFQPMDHPRVMPGDGWGLTQAQQTAFLEWIRLGAYWPEGKAGELKVKDYEVEIDDYL